MRFSKFYYLGKDCDETNGVFYLLNASKEYFCRVLVELVSFAKKLHYINGSKVFWKIVQKKH